MVIAVDPNTNETRGSEYGRYSDDYGNARRVTVPNFTGDISDKKDVKKYAKRLLKSYVNKHGSNKVGNKINITYIPKKDYNKAVQDMKDSEKNGLKHPYSWATGITCGSYAHNIAVGDDPSDKEFGTPSMAAPTSILPGRFKISYDKESDTDDKPALLPRKPYLSRK